MAAKIDLEMQGKGAAGIIRLAGGLNSWNNKKLQLRWGLVIILIQHCDAERQPDTRGGGCASG